MRVARPHRTQGRVSIQRNRVSVVFPQRSQFWGPRSARRPRHSAQVRSKLRVSFSGTDPSRRDKWDVSAPPVGKDASCGDPEQGEHDSGDGE